MGLVILGIILLILSIIFVLKVFGLALTLVWTLLVGLFIGALARFLVPGEQKLSPFATSLYGIVGAFLGKAVAGLFGLGTALGFVLSVGVAALLITMTAKTTR